MTRVATKSIVVGLVLAALGLPVLDTWRVLVLAAAVLAVVFGVPRPGRWRLAAALGLVLAVLGAKALLPRADIAEAHNAFLVIHDGEALERGLPPEVFASWKAQFDALYPGHAEDTAFGYWRGAAVPATLFTESADAIWRHAKYTRQVDAIDFRTLGEFRGGFANEARYDGSQSVNLYNFWAGELSRESIPFYVMYELTPASVGSRFVWKGQAFWQRPDGHFEEIVHSEIAGRVIVPEDAGRRVYAAFFPKRDPQLFFRMEPSLTFRLAQWADLLLTLIGGTTVLLLTINPSWGALLTALSMFAAGYAVMMGFVAVSAGKYLGRAYPPQSGGDDGMVHDGWGRMMALFAARGDLVEALKGTEAVYWFTPGMRYFRMLEKLIFGDTNHLYALLVPCIAIIVFYLIRHFLGARWAWIMTGIFCLMPVGNFSFLQYLANAKLGYGEALAGGLFLLAMLLMLRTEPAWGGTERKLSWTWAAGAALAASMFIRPNFAFGVIWLGAAYAWTSWRQKDLPRLAALMLGLGLAFWMTFHNWYYGHEFYFISKSGTAYAITIGWRDYLAAAGDVLHGRFDTRAATVVSRQLAGWLLGLSFVVRDVLRPLAWAAHAVKLFALLVTSWVAVRWVAGGFAKGSDLGVVAVAAICAHVPMLFTFSVHYRYAMLGWDLSLVVLIVWFARVRSTRHTGESMAGAGAPRGGTTPAAV